MYVVRYTLQCNNIYQGLLLAIYLGLSSDHKSLDRIMSVSLFSLVTMATQGEISCVNISMMA